MTLSACSNGMGRHRALLEAMLLQISPATPAEDLTQNATLLSGALLAVMGASCFYIAFLWCYVASLWC